DVPDYLELYAWCLESAIKTTEKNQTEAHVKRLRSLCERFEATEGRAVSYLTRRYLDRLK
ncbi:MAG: hypothetical protein AAF492_18505, partial [Verrucomicrobiota bacterium]